jgi:phenylpropionate dioxygenase-like ring-hydroxylating dioxygenase large terminal subunit
MRDIMGFLNPCAIRPRAEVCYSLAPRDRSRATLRPVTHEFVVSEIVTPETVTPETGLPPWTYWDEDFFSLEREKIFAPSWQIVCHESDLPERGRYATMSFIDELVLVLRGEGGRLNAFRNVCRHRAARLLDEPFGQCGARIVCPYHAWTYDLEGRLIGVPERAAYEPIDLKALSLQPLEVKSAGGFIFVRMKSGGESFEEFAAPFAAELALYRAPEMTALGRITLRERAVNWKVATDNYVDKLHLPVAHDGLNSLVSTSYKLSVRPDGAYHITSEAAPRAGQSPSTRAYLKFLPEVDHLPTDRRRKWVYIKLWPNLAFDIYPDQIDFMQFIPLSPTRTLLREISYALPDRRREMRAARYLNWRINRIVNIEDKGLIERVQAGYETARIEGGYQPGPISREEICLKDFSDRLKRELPIAREARRPSREMFEAARLRG